MTIAATGPLRTDAIRTEYGGSTPMRLGDYRRGHVSGYVKANGSGNIAVNNSAAVDTTILRMSHFRGQAKGYTYTNTTQRISSGGNHFHCHTVFGTDWAANTWPMHFINNAVLGSTDTGTYALVIYGRNVGTFTFTNNNEIQGAGGQPNSGAGQHAIYIYNSIAGPTRPIFINNYAVRGGGGAGGIGGAGGQGGPGAYNYTAEERPAFSSAYRVTYEPAHQVYHGGGGGGWHNEPASGAYYWGSKISSTSAAAVSIGGYTYYRGSLVVSNGQPWGGGSYMIYRTWTATAYTSGGAGGGGGNGGRGIGYNSPNQGGLGGAGGGAPQTNAGWGGTGGAGGTGGSWGAPGGTGGTGATGQAGNAGGGAGGAAGAGGGAAGYSIYAATPWGFVNNNTINGPYGGAVAPS